MLYLCYSINNPICNDEDLFSAHEHLFAYQMNKVDINRLPKKVKVNITNAIKVLKNNDLFKVPLETPINLAASILVIS